MKPRTRILLVIGTGEAGGAELATLTLMGHVPEDVELHVLSLTPGPVADRLRVLGFPVATASLGGRPSVRRAARFHRHLARLLERVEPAVVYAVGIKAAALCAPAARAARIPIVWHKVDFAHDDWLARPLARACSAVVAVSEAVAEAVPDARVTGVLPPPVRLPEEYRASGDPDPPAL